MYVKYTVAVCDKEISMQFSIKENDEPGSQLSDTY